MEPKLQTTCDVYIIPRPGDYSFEQVTNAVYDLETKIRVDQQDYSCIVAPVRGGLVPAVMLSHRLGIPMFPLLYSLRDHKATEDVSQSLISYVADKHKQPVLIIDDIVDGGQTMQGALEHLRDALPPVVIQVAALVHNTEAPVHVSYSYQQIKRSEFTDWFYFPWEI